jgi:hypothetical protein
MGCIVHISTWAEQPLSTLKLCLPDLIPGSLWHDIEVPSDFKGAHSPRSHSDAPISRTSYTTDGPDICVLSLSILPEPTAFRHIRALLVVDRRSLLRLVAPYLRCGGSAPADPSTSTTIQDRVDWSMWGPQTARYIPLGNVDKFLISGWRIIFSARPRAFPLVGQYLWQAGLDPDDDFECRRIALDFNPYRAGLDPEHTVAADSVLRWCPDNIVKYQSFAEPLVTTRPCRIFVGEVASPAFSHADCCGDMIIDFWVSRNTLLRFRTDPVYQDRDRYEPLCRFGKLLVF